MLIPLPYRLLGALLLALSLIAGGVWYGTSATNDRRDAKELIAERAATKRLNEEIARGNGLSARLSVAESAIQIKTIERIKYVPKVTTGKPCLSADAVSLLNGSDKLTLRETAGQPVAESPGDSAATDTDVEAWIIGAQGVYETCAIRLNTLIDFENGRAP